MKKIVLILLMLMGYFGVMGQNCPKPTTNNYDKNNFLYWQCFQDSLFYAKAVANRVAYFNHSKQLTTITDAALAARVSPYISGTPYTGGRGVKINSYVVRIDSTVQILWTNGLKFGSSSYFINSSGNTYFNNGGAATKFSAPTWEFAGNSIMTSPTDGSIRLTYNVGSDFDRLQFGGTTSSYPSLQRKGVKLVARLADNSGNTHQQVKDTVYSSAWNGRIDVPTMNAVYDKVETLVKYTDTAAMLTKYLRSSDTLKLHNQVAARVKYSDTAAMLTKYLRSADTLKLHNQVAARVKYSDTASMLSPYVLESQVYSGTWTPSFTDAGNTTSFTARTCYYQRTGNRVTCYGTFGVVITNTATATTFRMTLPITSTFTTIYQAGGTGIGGGANMEYLTLNSSTSYSGQVFFSTLASHNEAADGTVNISFMIGYNIN